MATHDPLAQLESEHRMVESLLEQIADGEPSERTQLCTQLQQALSKHMRIEETIVYPLVGELIDEDDQQEAETEHQLARTGLEQMMALLPDEPGFGAALEMLKAGIAHHVREEEDEIFPQLRQQAGDRWDQMVQQFEQAQAGGELIDLTRDELMDKAREADIPGRSSMTKDELVEALTGR